MIPTMNLETLKMWGYGYGQANPNPENSGSQAKNKTKKKQYLKDAKFKNKIN